MFRKYVSLLCFILFPSLAYADATVKLPPEIHAKQGRIIKITAETTSKYISWLNPSEDADLIPMEGTKSAIFCSDTPGTYKVICVVAEGDKPSEFAVCNVIVDKKPVPDNFKDTLQKIYKANASKDKEKNKATLSAIYLKAISSTINDKSVTTAGQILNITHNTAQTLLADELKDVRDAIALELNDKLPFAAETILDDKLRKLIGDQFQRMADTLTAIQ